VVISRKFIILFTPRQVAAAFYAILCRLSNGY